MMVNLPENNFDTIISPNRGLTLGNNKSGGLGFCGTENENGLLESFDSNAAMKKICFSRYYHCMDFFATYICNQEKNSGVKKLKDWVDTGV